MRPQDIDIKNFTYLLPTGKIAVFPLPERDASRLLIYNKGNIREDKYKNIADYLEPGSTLVFNNTRVMEARILFRKPTGGIIEIFVLEPSEIYPDIHSALLQKGQVSWKCLIGGAAKWKHGLVLEKIIGKENPFKLTARIEERLSNSFLISFRWEPGDLNFADILHQSGIVPLPPYLKRETEASDNERYQTIYASEEGSVAAPTAGLHFTDHIFQQLISKNISTQYLTLHVGAGTFKPVKSARLLDHEMHAEFIDVSLKAVESIRLAHKIYAVGTTSFRTIESLYWMGVKASINANIEMTDLEISQWEVYDELSAYEIDRDKALDNLLTWMISRKMERIICRTRILIAPGYTTRVASGLITNFHQPQSTLLLLIAALLGTEWRRIYQYALDNDFRFLSYGDGMLIEL